MSTLILLVLVAAAGVAGGYAWSSRQAAEASPARTEVAGATTTSPTGASGVTPALTITTVQAQRQAWPRTLGAQGSISAWQEAVIGPEVGGMRIEAVRANVGDVVRRGDVLATLVPTTLANDLASQQASLAEARAALAEAQANAARARKLQDTGAISSQQVNQYLTAEQTARARVSAVDARIRTDRLRLDQASLQSPDDGVISARLATPGAVAQAGQELFRLIRGGRLEWRADVPAADLGRIAQGMVAIVTLPDGTEVRGTTRVIAPTVDPMTRNGLVYVDLASADVAGASAPAGAVSGAAAGAAAGSAAGSAGAAAAGSTTAAGAKSTTAAAAAGQTPRAGMFARGRFELGQAEALTLPATAVAVRDGFAFVFRVNGDRVALTRVTTGRRQGDRLEILDGLGGSEQVAASGVGFLADGDVVAVVADPK